MGLQSIERFDDRHRRQTRRPGRALFAVDSGKLSVRMSSTITTVCTLPTRERAASKLPRKSHETQFFHGRPHLIAVLS